jgi:ABC-2 type transport system ATP-binding protein
VPAIETKALTRHYGALIAVDHLDLAVQPGELFAFLGPNGAGKTTTIRMLTGLIHPTEGIALVDGTDIARDPLAVKRRVGVVPERSNLYGELSARDNLVFMAQLYGLPRARWRLRADELLAQFRLEEKASSRFASLSGGMKRRLTIAAALIHEPSILFLDEPTTGLDVQSARGLRKLVVELNQRGVTVFLTTHLIAEAEQLAHRVAIIVKGKLVTVDTPAALCARVQGENVLELAVTEPTDGLVAALSGSTAVESLSRRNGVLHLTVSSVDAAVRDIAAITQHAGVRITDIRTVTPSLEDAFVQLTHLDAEAMQSGGPRRPEGRQG